MARREHSWLIGCAESGCKETEFYLFSIKADWQAHYQRRRQEPFRCARHSSPEEVISFEHPRRELVYMVVEERGRKVFSGGRTTHSWLGGGLDDFQVYAKDFPVGTTVTITVALTAGEVPDGGV